MISLRRVIGVMGSGRSELSEECLTLCRDVGEVIAALGCDLLTGGGGGVMEAVAIAFTQSKVREGISIGILRPESHWKPAIGAITDQESVNTYVANAQNAFLELVIRTHLPNSDDSMMSRNHINVLTPEVIVFLPGGKGTQSELELAMCYAISVVLYLGNGRIAGQTSEQLIQRDTELLRIASNTDDLLQNIEANF